MNHNPAASQTTHLPPAVPAAVACLFLLLTAILFPATAAGASGTVSVSIRLEVGVADLHSGGYLDGMEGRARAERALSFVAPIVRQSLKDRYHPAELDRIVDEVASHAILLMDGEAVSNNATDSAFVTTDHGSCYSL